LINPRQYDLGDVPGRSYGSTGFAILDERIASQPEVEDTLEDMLEDPVAELMAEEPVAEPVVEPVAEPVAEPVVNPVGLVPVKEEAPGSPPPDDEAELWAMHEELLAEEAAHQASLQKHPDPQPTMAPNAASPTLSDMPDEELQEFLAMNAAALDGMNFQLPPAATVKMEPNREDDSSNSPTLEPPVKKMKIGGAFEDIVDDEVKRTFEAMIGEQKPRTEKVQTFGGGNVLLKYDEAVLFEPPKKETTDEPIDGKKAHDAWMKMWGTNIAGSADAMKHKHWFLFELRGIASNKASEIFGGEAGIDKMFLGLLWDVMDLDLSQSVLVYKPKFQTLVLVVERVLTQAKIKFQAYVLALPTGLAAREILCKMLEARTDLPFQRIATMRFANEEAQEEWTYDSLMGVVGDDNPEQFAARVLAATIKKAGGGKLSNFEQLLCCGKVQAAIKNCKALQDKKNEAAALLKSVVKQLSDTTFWGGVPKWSDDTFECMDKEGIYWEDDGAGFKEKRVKLREAVENPDYHMTRAFFISGTSGIGKTTLSKTIGRYWAANYWIQDQHEKQGRPVELDEDAVRIVYTAAMQSLNITTNKGFLKQYVPIVVDDTHLMDAAQHKTGDSGSGKWAGLRPKYITQMLEVVNSGDVGARYKNVYFDLQ
jgi:hypothetical protein